jgi:hypothetical protein
MGFIAGDSTDTFGMNEPYLGKVSKSLIAIGSSQFVWLGSFSFWVFIPIFVPVFGIR